MNPTGGAFEGLRAEGTGMPGHSFFFFSPVVVVTLGDMTELVCGSGWEEVGILLKITPQKTNMTMENHQSK